MLQILQSDMEILVHSGFIYLPLLLDQSIEEELRQSGPLAGSLQKQSNSKLIEAGGRTFVKSVGISSFLANYEKLDPETCEFVRTSVASKFMNSLDPGPFSMDEELRIIIFEVMPHFVHKKNRLRTRKVSGEEILDLIQRKANIPRRFYEEANRISDSSVPRRKPGAIDGTGISETPPFSGIVSAHSFRRWFLKALESRILEKEKERLDSMLSEREWFSSFEKKHIAVLLYIKERGEIEINGCGFFRNGATSEYFVYVRTGRYALKDSYRRIYLFPDCRVAVSAYGPLVPHVVDEYKHPFLKSFGSMQKICVSADFVPAEKFSARGAILALEEGVNAIFHGYNSRRGNGYNRLDGLRFQNHTVAFDDYRIQPGDPRIVSGEIEVKNDFY